MKEKGILLPIFSLPTKYGIGDFGHEAYEFVDILSENGMTYWNLLPICANNNLPYSPTSYFALEEDYISLDLLKEEGLIKDAEIRENKDRAVYDDFKEKYYKEAYSNFEKTDGYYDFIRIYLKNTSKISRFENFYAFIQLGFLWFALYFAAAAYFNSRVLMKVFNPLREQTSDRT